MTLFTAEGILEAERRGQDVVEAVRQACVRWLRTQRGRWDGSGEGLLAVRELHASRAPGMTCLEELAQGRPVAGSKGCGAVMRVAPVGLVYGDEAMEVAMATAGITHGHPTALGATGFFGHLVARLVEGDTVEETVEDGLRRLERSREFSEVVEAAERAMELASGRAADREAVEAIGEGFTAEEALGIALFCAARCGEDFRRGVLAAVNHGGDSDSTGAMAGNLLGLLAGPEGIPSAWLERLELRDLVGRMADGLLEAALARLSRGARG